MNPRRADELEETDERYADFVRKGCASRITADGCGGTSKTATGGC